MPSDAQDVPRFLPLGIDVRGKYCLVVGGGSIGTRKALTLARFGAEVTVLSPAVSEGLAEQIKAGRIRWVRDSFEEKHLGGVFLVVAATDDKALNGVIGRSAGQCGALFCDASSAERSRVIFGALLEEKDVSVAVFTGGRDPAQARRVRDQIANLMAGQGGWDRPA